MYKVILFNHGETAANGRVLLDTSSGENPGLTQAVVETKLNEAGSFSYAIVPTHPLYEMTAPLKVYVVVEEDGTEIFYGRIISVQINPLTKIKAVTCEGALAFLLDCELPKDSEDRESTAANYFTYCVNKYNEGIRNDPNRLLRVGTIDIDKASEQHTYKNGSYSQIQSTMKSQLLDVHDGFFRVRKDSGTGEHYIDWVKQVGQTNPQSIAITHNVISQNSTESGEDIFSLMRPLGNGDITIGENDGLLTVSQNMLDDYGAIIRSVNFDAKSASSLKTKALEYIEKIKNRLTITGDISFVDFHFLDGSSTKVHVGDVFTNIEGYVGTKLTAESVTRNLLDAGKDKLSIKNDKELMKSAAASGANSSRSTGTSSGGRASRNSAMMYKFYHETNTDASIQARNIALEADKKIELKAQEVVTYADQIDEQLSEAIGKVKVNTDTLKEEWSLYKGTEIYRNQDHIDQVCGLYRVVETKDPRTGEVTDRKLIVKEGTGLYQTRNGVELGVYDNGNLTGGIMAQKINGQTETLIKGNKINIGDTGSTVKLSDKITVVDGGTLIKGLVMFKASDSATNSVSINNGKVTAETVQPTTLTFHGSGGEDDYVNLGYATVANMLTNAEVDTANNLLKIWKIGDAANNPSITFSKATSLSGAWSGGSLPKTLTVTASPQGNTYQVQFDGTYSATRTNLEVSLGGSISIETVMGAKMLSIPVNISRLTGTSSAPDIVYQTNISAAYNALLTSRTGSNKITVNGMYNPGSDYIGFSSVEVDVPDKDVGTRFGAGNGSYWVEGFYRSESGAPAIANSSIGYKLETTGTKAGTIVQIKQPETGGTKIANSAELNVGGLYTEGLNDVTINKGSWSGGQISFTKSAGTASTKSVQLTAATPVWAGNVVTVRMWDGQTADPQQGGLDTGYDVTVNAASKLTTLNATTNNHTYTPGSNYIGYSSVHVSVPDKAVNTRFGSASGNYYVESYYSGESGSPSIEGTSITYKLGTSGTKGSTKVQIQNASGIKIANSAELPVGSLYTGGWDDCVATKKWVADASKTLTYGESVGASASIKDKNGNTVSIGAATYVAPDYATPYNAGGATAWIESISAVANPEQFTPGTYIAPSYVKYGASSATVKDHTWYVPTAWLDSAGSSAPAGTVSQGELAYDTIYYVRYQTPTGWDGNKWASGFWKTKKDRWQDGYNAGAGSVSHSATASASFPWTGSIAGRTSLGKVSYTSLHNSYILIDTKCGGQAGEKYYITVN